MVITNDYTTWINTDCTKQVTAPQPIDCKVHIQDDLVIIRGPGARELFLRLIGTTKKGGEA